MRCSGKNMIQNYSGRSAPKTFEINPVCPAGLGGGYHSFEAHPTDGNHRRQPFGQPMVGRMWLMPMGPRRCFHKFSKHSGFITGCTVQRMPTASNGEPGCTVQIQAVVQNNLCKQQWHSSPKGAQDIFRGLYAHVCL